MIRVFLDANVLFSAGNRSSPIARLIDLCFDRAVVVTSDLAVEEARRNVALKRPDWADELQALIQRIQVEPSIQFELPVPLAPKDQPILCTAIRCDCQYLVTGDRRDFGHLYDQAVQNTVVIDLKTLARVLLDR